MKVLLWMFSCTQPVSKLVIDWAEIPAGTFTMGSPADEVKILDDELQHEVSLSAFKMSKYEITVKQFKAFVDATGYVTDAEKVTGLGTGSITWPDPDYKLEPGVDWRCDERGNLLPESKYDRPVIFVSWNDATAFALWMKCRLPTEAEWEYACRAGTTTSFNAGETLSTTKANYYRLNPYNEFDAEGSFREHTLPACSLEPNAWGLYNMHGNVSEWCSDWYEYDYPEMAQKDPSGPIRGLSRVARGGSWCTDAMDCRSASRSCHRPDFHYYDLGFRIVSATYGKKNLY